MKDKPDKKGAETKPLKTIIRSIAQEGSDRISFEKREVREPEQEPEKEQEPTESSREEIEAKRSFRNIYVPQKPGEHLFLQQERY